MKRVTTASEIPPRVIHAIEAGAREMASQLGVKLSDIELRRLTKTSLQKFPLPKRTA